mmetsp:Transcript_20596/g.34880  ORF Transcript_20596/g.34880 Transcript_20596/m.34880 type:complete len:249 (-) Transcript_20596:225-971(-)
MPSLTIIQTLEGHASPPWTKPSESSKTHQEDLVALDNQRVENAASTSDSTTKKIKEASSDGTSSPRKISVADTSHDTSAAANSDERNTHLVLSLLLQDRKRKSCTDEELGPENVARKKNRKKSLCSADGCTNGVIKGGVCIRHGAKVKRCSSEGCTNLAQRGGVCTKLGAKKKLCSSDGCTNQVNKGGVCWRHGASRTHCDGSTAFGSEYEKTTATLSLPNQSTAGASDESSTGVPGEVVICQEIVEV